MRSNDNFAMIIRLTSHTSRWSGNSWTFPNNLCRTCKSILSTAIPASQRTASVPAPAVMCISWAVSRVTCHVSHQWHILQYLHFQFYVEHLLPLSALTKRQHLVRASRILRCSYWVQMTRTWFTCNHQYQAMNSKLWKCSKIRIKTASSLTF